MDIYFDHFHNFCLFFNSWKRNVKTFISTFTSQNIQKGTHSSSIEFTETKWPILSRCRQKHPLFTPKKVSISVWTNTVPNDLQHFTSPEAVKGSQEAQKIGWTLLHLREGVETGVQGTPICAFPATAASSEDSAHWRICVVGATRSRVQSPLECESGSVKHHVIETRRRPCWIRLCIPLDGWKGRINRKQIALLRTS